MTNRDTYDIEQYELEQIQEFSPSLSVEKEKVLQIQNAMVELFSTYSSMNKYYTSLLDHIENTKRYGV